MHLPHLTSPGVSVLTLALALGGTNFTSTAYAQEPAHLPKEDPLDALAIEDDFASVELRSDARLFALYAAFNALGYDAAAVTDAKPFPRKSFSPLRQQVRRGTSLSPSTEAIFLQVFQKSDEALVAYETCVAALTQDFHLPSDNAQLCPGALIQLPQLLRHFWASSHSTLAPIYPAVSLEARHTLKPFFLKLHAFHSALTALFPKPAPHASPNKSLWFPKSAQEHPAPDLVVTFNELSSEKVAVVQRGKIYLITFGRDDRAPDGIPPEALQEATRVLTQKTAEKACGKLNPSPEAVASLVQEVFRNIGQASPHSKARTGAQTSIGSFPSPKQICDALFER